MCLANRVWVKSLFKLCRIHSKLQFNEPNIGVSVMLYYPPLNCIIYYDYIVKGGIFMSIYEVITKHIVEENEKSKSLSWQKELKGQRRIKK